MRCYAQYVQSPYTIRIRACIAHYVMFCKESADFDADISEARLLKIETSFEERSNQESKELEEQGK